MKTKMYIIMMMAVIAACKSLKPKQNTVSQKIYGYQPLYKFNGDTLAFVQKSILDRKDYYKGKEFNVLLKDLKIPVKTYSNTVSPVNRFITKAMYFDIYSNAQQEYKAIHEINPLQLVVTWDKPLSMKICDSLAQKSHYNWGPEVAEYYGKQIIGDIGIVQYNFK